MDEVLFDYLHFSLVICLVTTKIVYKGQASYVVTSMIRSAVIIFHIIFQSFNHRSTSISGVCLFSIGYINSSLSLHNTPIALKLAWE